MRWNFAVRGPNESGQVRCIIINNFASKFVECLWLIDRRHCDPNKFDFQLPSKHESTDRHTNQFWFAFRNYTMTRINDTLVHTLFKMIFFTQTNRAHTNTTIITIRTIDEKGTWREKKPHTVLSKLLYQHETKSTLQYCCCCCFFLFQFVSTISIFSNYVLITHAWQRATQYTRTTKRTAAKLFDVYRYIT